MYFPTKREMDRVNIRERGERKRGRGKGGGMPNAKQATTAFYNMADGVKSH